MKRFTAGAYCEPILAKSGKVIGKAYCPIGYELAKAGVSTKLLENLGGIYIDSLINTDGWTKNELAMSELYTIQTLWDKGWLSNNQQQNWKDFKKCLSSIRGWVKQNQELWKSLIIRLKAHQNYL